MGKTLLILIIFIIVSALGIYLKQATIASQSSEAQCEGTNECTQPKTTEEWLQYCDKLEDKNCYINAIKIAVKHNFEYAHEICDKYWPKDAEQCKIESCELIDRIATDDPCIKNATKKSSCYDLIKNGRETDADCGGPDCKSCSIGNSCQINEDCKNLACNSNGTNPDFTCSNKCPDGKIIDNTPCYCDGEMRYKKAIETWQAEYGHLENNRPQYCCNNRIQFTKCY